MSYSAIFAMLVATSAQNCGRAETTVAIAECANAEYRRADAEMTREWKAAFARMKRDDSGEPPPPSGELSDAAALLDSQRKWLSFRDSQCRVIGYQMRGGSGQGYSTTFCLIELTEQRTRQLRQIVSFGQ
jgi:uncharacterized protein YecT (DUF1311 family)